MNLLLATWYDAAWHPAMIFTSQILAEQGHAVHIVYRQPNPERTIPGAVDYGRGVQLHAIGRGQDGWRNQAAYLDFIRHVTALARRLRPDVIIGYDMHGLAAASIARRVQPETRLVYHNFDLAAKELLSGFGRAVKYSEGGAARSSDLVIASSPGRAQALQQEHRLKRKPLVILNCQRIGAYTGLRGELQAILDRQGLHFDRIVVRLGSLGPHHGIEATIRSAAAWQGPWGLVLAGIGSEDYVASLRALISQLGLDRQVLLLSPVSYELWYDCLYSADLGIALYEKGNINHDSMAGAGNKLNLHLKAGIPSIVPDIPDFETFVLAYDAGRVALAHDAASIAASINAILGDDATLARLRRNAANAFAAEFNFEKQVEPLLAWLADPRANPA
jgi:glycosyltransferase involved in cell wall biosynthesis